VTPLPTPRFHALTIAGSDSGGGAGIQADLRAFASQGVFGLSAITAITAQNSTAVERAMALPASMVRAQIEAVVRDFPVGAVKTGMLATAPIVRVVAAALATLGAPAVVDPVMIATSGARLLDAACERALLEQLLPRAEILTPNIPEAEALLGRRIRRASDLEGAAVALRALGPTAVLLKGGHLGRGREVVDLFLDDAGVREFRAPRLRFRGHGTGCTLASLIAARLALGEPRAQAVASAIAAFRSALANGVAVGKAGVYTPQPIPAALERVATPRKRPGSVRSPHP
jgi:hydroxymethylpyrimidine/phosphomethylpyrimidine kinase